MSKAQSGVSANRGKRTTRQPAAGSKMFQIRHPLVYTPYSIIESWIHKKRSEFLQRPTYCYSSKDFSAFLLIWFTAPTGKESLSEKCGLQRGC